MRTQLGLVAAALAVGALSCSEPAEQDDRPRVEADGTVHIPAFDLPETSYFSEESRAAMKHFRDVYGPEFGTFSEGCANLNDVAGDPEAIRAARQCVADGYYETSSIGIYGCSAGAMLTAQTVAYILEHDLPLPGAIGLFCAGIPTTDGDTPGVFKMSRSESAFLASALGGFPRPVEPAEPLQPSGYFRGVGAGDRVVAPGDHDDLLSRFPPALLISGTRDFALGGVLASHNKLVSLGVEADLHVWEGLGHATFAFNPRLPESDEVHEVIVRFFDRHLSR